MVTRSLLFIINTSYQKLPFGSGDLSSGDDVHPRLVLLILIGIYEYRTITHLIRIRALLLHRLSGTPAKFFFPTKVFSMAGVHDEGVRVGSHTHEDIRVKVNYPYMHEQHDRWWSDHC